MDARFYDGSATNPGQALSFTPVAISALSDAQKRQLRYDADVLGRTSTDRLSTIIVSLTAAQMADINKELTTALNLSATDGTSLDDGGGTDTIRVIRRLTHFGYRDSTGDILAGSKDNHITFYTVNTDTGADNVQAQGVTLHYPVADSFEGADATGGVVGAHQWPLELATNAAADGVDGAANGKDLIPEIDIKVDSIAVTAVTKKLKAKW